MKFGYQKKKRTEQKKFEVIMVENFPQLVTGSKPLIQEAKKRTED